MSNGRVYIVAGNYEEFNGFYIGTWRERPDIEEIQQVIAHVKQRTKLIENIEDIHEN